MSFGGVVDVAPTSCLLYEDQELLSGGSVIGCDEFTLPFGVARCDTP